MKPVELCQILMAFTERGFMNDSELMDSFQSEFKGRYEAMNPMDTSTFYYCFTKLEYKGDGMFYKYLQKAVTKTIRSFEGPHLRLMFYKFDSSEQMRLNRGVQGRLIEHCKYLMRENLLKGFDANAIYQYTKNLRYEKPKYHDPVIDLSGEQEQSQDQDFYCHDLNVQLRNYLEKNRYFS